MRLLLKNVRLETGYVYEETFVTATQTGIFDVLMEAGEFVDIAESIEVNDSVIIDAKEQLLLPSFKEMHTHIDKTYFGGPWKAPVPATDGIFTRFKEEATLLPQQLSVAEERAHHMVQHYLKNGHTFIRTHVNVDPHIGTQHVAIAKRVLAHYDDQLDYEIVAFPQHGLLRNGPEFLEVLEEALQMGVTHIGGVDPAVIDRQSQAVIQLTFDLARKYNIGVDMHLHERNTLGAFEIHRLLDEMERQPFEQNVTVSHAFALADLPLAELEFLVKRMAKLKVGVTTTVAMGAGPITLPVKYLFDNGVDVAFGHDSLIDHWSPFGSGDTIQKLNHFVQRFGYIDEWHLGQSLKYATGGLTPLTEEGCMQWPKVGDRANAILVDAVSSAHFIARKCPISTVISKGAIVHQVEMVQKGALR